MFLVVYSGRGLVSNTEPSLRLFNILFWIFWLTLSIWGVSLWLFESMGRYSNYFRLQVIISYVSADVVLMILLEKLKTKYVRGQCLSQTSNSAFGGKHRRNIFSGQEIRIYAHLLQFAEVFEQILLNEPFNIFGQKKVQSLTTLVLIFFLGLFLPFKHIYSSRQDLPEMFDKRKERKTCEFYVRKPEKLLPRQSCNISLPKPQIKPCVKYRKGQVRRQEKCQHFIMQVEPTDILQVEKNNQNVGEKSKYLVNTVTNITVQAEVHGLPDVIE